MKKVLAHISIMVCLLIPMSAFAVYFASDTVTLSENGKKITDSKTLWAADYGYGGVCPNGVCDIGQQFYPVTIYRLKSSDIKEFGEYEEAPGSKQGVSFHRYLKTNSFYSIVFRPPASKGGEGCGSPGCMGGRTGDERTFDLDLKTQKYSIGGIQNDSPTVAAKYPTVIVLVSSVLLILAASIVAYVIRKSKVKQT